MACTVLLLITMLPLATMLPVAALETPGGEIKCTEHNEGLYGQRSVLDCSIQKTEQNMDILVWKKGRDILVEYYRGRLTVTNGFGFAEPKWTEENITVSLIIENTTVAHEGEYTVKARGDFFDDEQRVNLRVTGKYSEPTVRSEPEQVKQKEAVTLSCTSEHGYPGSLNEMKCTKHNEGLYGQRSVLDCSIQKTEQNMQLLVWKKGRDVLVEYYRGRLTVTKGFGFPEPKWTEDNIIVSLIIENTTVAHEGEYTVKARGQFFDDEQKVNLRVTGKYSEPTVRSEPEQVKQKEAVTLSCTSEHGYPGSLNEMKCTKHNEGLYGQRSVLDCSIQKTEQNMTILVWKKGRDVLVEYYRGRLTVRKGFGFPEPKWTEDNITVSLIIENTTVAHEGEYTVTARGEFFDDEQKVNLRVTGEEEGRIKLALNEGETDTLVKPSQPTTIESLKLSPNVVAPLVVIGSLIVGLPLLVVYFKRRAAQRHVPVNTEENIELSV